MIAAISARKCGDDALLARPSRCWAWSESSSAWKAARGRAAQ
jgi:hypothetical protein